MKKNILYCFAVLFFFVVQHIGAQEDAAIVNPAQKRGIKDYTKAIINSASVGIEYRIKAGVGIGGTSPLPLPIEIRSIDGYSPKLNMSIEGEINKSFNDNWALSFGLRLETKGMRTIARVKAYHIVIDEGAGLFTGTVKTTVNNTYLTLPVLAVWKPSERWGIKLGPYCSYMFNGQFTGSVSDGYLREEVPTGAYIAINNALYDYSNDLRNWHFGVQTGAEWRAFPHLLISLDLMWGINNIFEKDFDVITFNMYPIYASLNFGYSF